MGLLLILSSGGILTQGGWGRMAPQKPFDWGHTLVGGLLLIGGTLMRRSFGPALRFRLPKH